MVLRFTLFMLWCASGCVALSAVEPLELLLPVDRDARSGGALMAEDAGLFRRAGLEVRLRWLIAGEDALGALGADHPRCAVVGDQILRTWANDQSVVLVGVFTREPLRRLVVRSDGGVVGLAELLALPPARRPAWPEPADLGLQIAVRKLGADPDLAFSPGPAQLTEFVRGNLSAFPATLRDRAHLARLGVAVRVLPGAGNAFGHGLATHRDLARRRPSEIAALVAALREGWELARREPERLVALLERTDVTRSEVAQDVDAVLATLSGSVQPSPELLATVANAARSAGLEAAAPGECLWQPGTHPMAASPPSEAPSSTWPRWSGEALVAGLALIVMLIIMRRRRHSGESAHHGDPKSRLTQDQLLPDLPQLPDWEFAVHYRPHAGVSGDFYLASSMADGRWLIAVGDVSGHGVQAALVVSGVLKAGELLARRHDDLAAWLAALQETVAPDLRRGLFVTMVVVAIDALTGEIECVRSGHPPAFRSGPEGWSEVGGIGPAIGIGDSPAFRAAISAQRLTLGADDDLLLFTDGLTEIIDRSGQEFGVAGLRASVQRHHGEPAQSLVDALAQDATGHGKGVTDDDLTVLVIRRRPGVKT